MLFRKDYAFLELLVGVIAFFTPIFVVLIISPENVYSRGFVFVSVIFGLVLGFLSGFTILEGYYKLTQKLKFMEYEDFKNSEKSKESE